MRQTELRRSPDGYYRRNLGYVRTKSGGLSPHKISLGTNRKLAAERLKLVAAIWTRIEAEATRAGEKPVWDRLSREIATAVGKGEKTYRVQRFHMGSYRYCQFTEVVANSYPEIAIVPGDEEAYRAGKAFEQEKQGEVEVLERELLADAAYLKQVALETEGNDSKYVDLLGDQSLHQALDEYSKWIAVEKFDQSEEAVNDTGVTRQNMVKQIKTYLAPDRPLASLNDFASIDGLFGILRKRPITVRYQKPMAKKSASNLIGELGRFFDWLHHSSAWEWRKPVDFSEIKRSPIELESDIDAESKDVPVYNVKQLEVLYAYATPLERLMMALGLNCAYGADQIGRLKIGEVVERKGIYYIKRVRRKKKVKGFHRLFATTLEGIKWATKGREDQLTSYVLVNGKGQPLWRKTKGENRSQDIPNAWTRLLNRVCKDHPDFPRHGFNTLRDTSSNLVRRIAGHEMASLHLTHKHQSTDANLRRYTNAPRAKLFKAHRELERRLASVFQVENAWKERTHQYVTTLQIQQMKQLRMKGVPVREIAETVGVSPPTVYRHTK